MPLQAPEKKKFAGTAGISGQGVMRTGIKGTTGRAYKDQEAIEKAKEAREAGAAAAGDPRTAGAALPHVPGGRGTDTRRWKPIGSDLVQKLNPFYLVFVLLLLFGYGWAGSRPLHHMIGKELAVVVEHVVDGDTFTARTVETGVTARFRLRQIDAPERDQPFGLEAKGFLEDLLLGDGANREVIVLLWEQDDWGRYIADCVIRDSVYTKVSFVQEELVKAGYAWVFGSFAKSKQGGLRTVMEEAQKNKLGLFQQENPVEPWRWRHNQRAEKKQQGRGGKKNNDDASSGNEADDSQAEINMERSGRTREGMYRPRAPRSRSFNQKKGGNMESSSKGGRRGPAGGRAR